MNLKYVGRSSLTTLFAGSMALLGSEAIATPTLSGEMPLEIQMDNTVDADDPGAELSDTYLTFEPAMSLGLTPTLSVEVGAVFEPVFDPAPGEDRAFEDEGAYIEVLFVQYATQWGSLFAGKVNPAFGTAWDVTPGIYGTDYAEDYELTERIGFGGSLILGGAETGNHVLTASTFFVDTTGFSRSAFEDRGQTDRADGGVSNTEDFSSFAVALDGDLPAFVPGLAYHLGVESQAAGEGDTEDELGFAVGLNGSIELGKAVALQPIFEFVHLIGAEGADQDRTYVTAGAAATKGLWNLSASITVRSTQPDMGPDIDDTLAQISAGYAFENGLGIDAGYRFTEEDRSSAHTLGLLVTYAVEF